MDRFFYLLTVSLALSFSCFGQDLLVRESEALSPGDELAALAVPPGFEIRLFAAEPMINKPINLAVDGAGRVWVSSTVEYPYSAAKERWSDAEGRHVRGSRDAIKILEDTDADGRADRVTDFADGLNIPTGVLPWHRPGHHLGCIAWSIPNIWYLADTDGDGKCDLREVLFGPLGYEKDTHGMCSSFRLGPDGWIYATHGFSNTSHLKAKDGSEVELHSGNVFRFRPDGSTVEVWSRGQVNPFGLAFDRRGNLYSADCHSAPVYQLIRGAVYPSFGKPHEGLGFGPAMIEHTHGSTGIAGIVYLDGGIWGAEWDDHVLIGNPVTSRVNLDHITFAGTTPRAGEKPDFITSTDPWFRPVDLALSRKGELYIADFYNRIIGHYEVPLGHPGRDRERGRIWQVVKSGQGTVTEPPTPVRDCRPPLTALDDDSPWTRRRAAAQLFERPTVEAVAPLMRALVETPDEDTHLRHALRLALKACLSQPGAYSKVGNTEITEIALVSLAVITPESAAWLLAHPAVDLATEDYPSLRCRHIASHGSPEVIAALIEESTGDTSLSDLLEIAETREERQGVLREARLIEVLTRHARERLATLPADSNPVWQVRAGDEPGWERQSRKSDQGGEIEVLSSLRRGKPKPESHTGVLLSRPFPLPERLAFQICGHVGVPTEAGNGKNFVRLVEVSDHRELARAEPPRNDLAKRVEWRLPEAVGKSVRLEIVDGDDGGAYAWLGLGAVEGADLPVLDFDRSERDQENLRRLARLLVTSAPVDLRDGLAPFLPAPPPAPPLEVSPEEQSRLSRLIADRVAAFAPAQVDADRGKALFSTHCRACHRLEGDGGLIGPQLEGIGSRGLARLSEDILHPNQNVDSHFRLTRIEKKDGTVLGGFVASESKDLLLLLDAGGLSHRVRADEIQSRETSALSLMPAVFGEILKPDEFRDLVGWLLQRN